MAKSNRDYWREREARQLTANLEEEDRYAERLDFYHTLMEASIQQKIDAFYQRYAKNNNISLAEAQRRVSQTDIRQFEAKARRYVELATYDKATGSDNSKIYFSKQANEQMRLYNLMMKINRLEMLKADIGMAIDENVMNMGETINGALTNRVDAELTRQAGILGETVFHNARDVQTIVNASFHNATWSERLWGEGTQLKANLNILLTQGLIAGKNPRELSRDLRRAFYVSRYEAERLMRTELARVQTDAQMESFRRNGYTQYEFLALETGCAECRALDGKVFWVNEEEVGVNSPPIHPNCRCSTAAYYDELSDNVSRNYDVFSSSTLYFDSMAPFRLAVDMIKRAVKLRRNPYKKPTTTLQIDNEAQSAHTEGSDRYNMRYKKARAKGLYGPSVANISVEKAQELVDKYHGSGKIKLNRNGEYMPWEVITDNDEIVGEVVNNITGKSVPTSVFKIHYSKSGTHIVPDYPSKKEG